MTLLSKMMMKTLLVLLLVSFVSAACQRATPGNQQEDGNTDRELVVFAAASLTEAFDELGATFSAAHPGVNVTANYAGSQQLAQQLASGAPADVFASANQQQMQAAVDAGRVVPGAAQPFAHNRLVVVMPADNPAGIIALSDLAAPGVKLVLADASVPVGRYSLDFLAKASEQPEYTTTYSETVLSNVVSYEDNVRAVLTKVQLGEADAGIVYRSDVTGAARDEVVQLDIPDELNVIATYPIAAVRDSAHPDMAAEFVAMVLSPEGQEILARYGFFPAHPD